MSDQNTVLERQLIETEGRMAPRDDRQGFVGSWRVTISPTQGTPALALATFGGDGTMVTAPPPVEPSPGTPGGVVFVSSGHGAWEAAGPDTAIFTFVGLGADGEGNPNGTGTVRANITCGPDGQTCSGSYTATMADPAGITVATEQGTLQATRIVAEAPGMPTTGTPVVPTPAG